MQRDDFIFTIGYEGSTAIVDKALRTKYGRFTSIQLYEKGLLKPAVASAIYEKNSGNDSDLVQLLERLRADLGEEMDEQKLRRIYGISLNAGDKVMLI